MRSVKRVTKLSPYINMRILAAILLMSALSIAAFAQGIVNFGNSPSTLVSYFTYNSRVGLISGEVGTWYFGLLTAPSPNGPFVGPSQFNISSVRPRLMQ
jgi:hypothetical protein